MTATLFAQVATLTERVVSLVLAPGTLEDCDVGMRLLSSAYLNTMCVVLHCLSYHCNIHPYSEWIIIINRLTAGVYSLEDTLSLWIP